MSKVNTGSKGKTWKVPHRQIPAEDIAIIFDKIFDGISIMHIARQLDKSEGYVRNVIWRNSDGIERFKHTHREARDRHRGAA